jgi:hypothetical protein
MGKHFIGWRVVSLSILLMLPFLGWGITRTIKSWQFDNRVDNHMREAFVDSNNIERDIEYYAQESGVARKALEDLHLTKGYTSIFDIGKEDDLEVYYRDVVRRSDYFQQLANGQYSNEYCVAFGNPIKDFEQYAEMRNLTNNPNKQSYRVPAGISIYPHKTLYLWWSMLGLVSFAFGAVGLIVFFEERGRA